MPAKLSEEAVAPKFSAGRETHCLHGPCLVLVWHKGDTEVIAREVTVPMQKRAMEM